MRFLHLLCLSFLMVPALLLTGCDSKPAAVLALSGASVAHIKDVRFKDDIVEGRIKVLWADHDGPPICIERLDWDSGELFLKARPDGECPRDSDGPPAQWLHVRSTRTTLGKLAVRPRLGGGSGDVTVRIGEETHTLSGKARPGFKLAPGAIVELGRGVIGPFRARLEVGSPLNPSVTVKLGVVNSLSVDLESTGGTWRILRGDRAIADGPLDLPETLPAGEEFEISIQLGPAEGMEIASGLLSGGAGPLGYEADIRLDTPWGEAIVRSRLPL